MSKQMANNWTDFCHKLMLLVLLNGLHFEMSTSLRIVRFEVPSAVAKGQPVVLHCNYDLEGDDLYSVKYYKDYVEFYRYLPNDEPNDEPRAAQKSFILKGAYVDISRSNATHAYLSTTDLHSDGMFACEVSTEGPSYATIRSERLMKVYALPQENLRIEGKEVQYDVNDKINLSCKSGDGRPLSDLSWFINDNMASKDQLVHYQAHTDPSTGLQSAKLGLVFLATPNFFHRGVLKLRCMASLTLLYEFEASESLISGVLKNKTQVGPYSTDSTALQPDNRETPIIKGIKQKYNVNDVLDVNCTSSAHEAHLKWLVNDAQAQSDPNHQLIRYASDESGRQALGLRFTMKQSHYQLQELKLKCIAQFRRTIADFQEHIVIRTMNQEMMEMVANMGIHSTAENEKYCGLTYALATIVWLSMQNIFSKG